MKIDSTTTIIELEHRLSELGVTGYDCRRRDGQTWITLYFDVQPCVSVTSGRTVLEAFERALASLERRVAAARTDGERREEAVTRERNVTK